jgi:unspecific monooxygenase
MTDSQVDVRGILGFDPFAPEFHTDPYAHYRELRSGGPLQRTPGGLWLSPSFEMCARILRDPRFGHGDSTLGEDTESRRLPRRVRSFLVLDPPEHTRLRRLVSRAFTARLIERLRPRVAAIVDELLGRMHGDVDLISSLAHPLPVIVISELLGVPPEDEERFKGWSEALARGLDPDFLVPAEELTRRDRAREEFGAYFRELADRRRSSPGDDLLSGLVAIEELSEADLIATCILLLVAGHETTVNLIANGTLALLRSPDQLAWFRANPDKAPAVVEELLRYDPPVQLSARVALEDAELDGQSIRRGQPGPRRLRRPRAPRPDPLDDRGAPAPGVRPGHPLLSRCAARPHRGPGRTHRARPARHIAGARRPGVQGQPDPARPGRAARTPGARDVGVASRTTGRFGRRFVRAGDQRGRCGGRTPPG